MRLIILNYEYILNIKIANNNALGNRAEIANHYEIENYEIEYYGIEYYEILNYEFVNYEFVNYGFANY